MNFKKTILLPSLAAVSTFAAAAPATPTAAPTPAPAPAPAAAAPVNLLQGVPAYVMTSRPWGLTAYTPLMDDDQVHVGGVAQGAWTDFVTAPTLYFIDFSGAPCVDKYGSCDGKPGKGAADVNTVVVHFEQALGTEIQPSATTLARDPAPFVELLGYHGDKIGVDVLRAPNDQNWMAGPWAPLGAIQNNTLAKHTFTFPTGKYSKFRIAVHRPFGVTEPSRLTHAAAFHLPTAPVKP